MTLGEEILSGIAIACFTALLKAVSDNAELRGKMAVLTQLMLRDRRGTHRAAVDTSHDDRRKK